MLDPIRVLCVGDLEPAVAALDDPGFAVSTSVDPSTALERLDREGVDCIVCDIEPGESPEMDGVDLVSAVRNRHPALPVILLVDGSSERTAEAIDAGVTDLHVRPDGDDPDPSIAWRVERAVERTETRGVADGSASSVDPIDDDSDSAIRSTGRAGDGTDGGDGRFPERTNRIFDDFDRYRGFIEAVADPMYILDDDGICIAANRAWTEYTGYDREVLEGRHASEFLDDTEYESAEETIKRLYEGDEGGRDAFEMTITTADGETRCVEIHVTVVTNERGEYVGSVGVMRDITKRKERIRELGQYEAIVETAPIGLFVVDEDGYLRWHNEEFTTDLGIEREIVGIHFAELAEEGYVPEEVLENHLDRVRHLLSSKNDDECLFYETEWVDANGERGVTELSVGLLPLEDGEFAGTVHAFRNVTDRVEYREELERQNERLERFASFVSHDLRNPLNIAQGHLDLLEAEDEDDSIETVRWAVDRMEELIDDLLTLARYGQPVEEPDRIDLADIAAEAWAGVDTAAATLNADVDASVIAHEGRVCELFENLFRNAVEHGSTSPDSQARQDAVEHGSTSPASQTQQDAIEHAGEDITVTVGRLENGAETSDGFFVEDDGEGLPDTDRIFQFGHTTTEDGTGFGLAIVAEIADAHGWTVTACEGREGGARFEIRDVTVLEARPSD